MNNLPANIKFTCLPNISLKNNIIYLLMIACSGIALILV